MRGTSAAPTQFPGLLWPVCHKGTIGAVLPQGYHSLPPWAWEGGVYRYLDRGLPKHFPLVVLLDNPVWLPRHHLVGFSTVGHHINKWMSEPWGRHNQK